MSIYDTTTGPILRANWTLFAHEVGHLESGGQIAIARVKPRRVPGAKDDHNTLFSPLWRNPLSFLGIFRPA